MRRRALRAVPLALALLAVAAAATSAAAQATQAPERTPTDLTTLDLEQLMQVEVVYAGSKRAQSSREVASAVSVVTAADIRQHGYRTLADILETLPGFFTTSDRNYSYVGVRGFARPGDYNSRVLLLVNGLRTNENLYDMAYVGEEFPVDVELIERVEVIRGPSAALYGSNALFAVINVVTRQGRDLRGGEVATSVGSFRTLAGRASYGRSVGKDGDLLLSLSASDAGGNERLYFPEFDDPATNGGVARGVDGERTRRLFGSISKGDFTLQAVHGARHKTVPTGAYAAAFNDPRFRTHDQLGLASLTFHRALADSTTVLARLHHGRFAYTGSYPSSPEEPAFRDFADGRWWGMDLDLSRRLFGRNVLTAGAEFRDNYRQNIWNSDAAARAGYEDPRNASTRWGVFAQDELRLHRAVTAIVGVRHDHYESFGGATSPRLGLILDPDAATTVKLLTGRAFRAPNEYELHYEDGTFQSNPLLEPERIRTHELVAQRRFGRGVLFSASAFRNRIDGLVSQYVIPASGLLTFVNAENIESRGLEAGIDVRRGGGVMGGLSYSLQKSTILGSGEELTNSPRHMGKLNLLAPLPGDGLTTGLTAGLDAQYLSARRTLAGGTAKGYLLTNLSLRAPRLLERLDVTATAYNLFDARYADPGSAEHVQDVIQQNGRSFRVRASLAF